MIVYRDIISGDEMLSDAYPLKPVVDKDGVVVRLFSHPPGTVFLLNFRLHRLRALCTASLR